MDRVSLLRRPSALGARPIANARQSLSRVFPLSPRFSSRTCGAWISHAEFGTGEAHHARGGTRQATVGSGDILENHGWQAGTNTAERPRHRIFRTPRLSCGKSG